MASVDSKFWVSKLCTSIILCWLHKAQDNVLWHTVGAAGECIHNSISDVNWPQHQLSLAFPPFCHGGLHL